MQIKDDSFWEQLTDGNKKKRVVGTEKKKNQYAKLKYNCCFIYTNKSLGAIFR